MNVFKVTVYEEDLSFDRGGCLGEDIFSDVVYIIVKCLNFVEERILFPIVMDIIVIEFDDVV